MDDLNPKVKFLLNIRGSEQKIAHNPLEFNALIERYVMANVVDLNNGITIDLAMKTLITNIISNPQLAPKIDANTNVHIGSTKPKPRKSAQNCCR